MPPGVGGGNFAAPHPFYNAGFSGGAPGDAMCSGTSEIAEKLRLAASKGLIDPMLFCNSGKLSNQTAILLNTMINLLTQVEAADIRIDQLKRSGAAGSQEFERLVRSTSDVKNQLSDLRDKIHASIDTRQPKGAPFFFSFFVFAHSNRVFLFGFSANLTDDDLGTMPMGGGNVNLFY